MRIYICDMSARSFWRREGVRTAQLFARSRFAKLVRCAKTAAQSREVDLARLGFDDGELHVMVPERGLRVLPSRFRYHVFSGEVPRGAFCKVSDSVYVASPEFCFVQAARTMPLAHLIAYADELCGTYARSASAQGGFFVRDATLSTVASLARFVQSVEYARNLANARRALKYAVDRSASPAETKLEMLLCLSRLLGGAAFRQATMNYELKLPPKAARMAGKSGYRPDLMWVDAGVAVEYNSRLYHADDAKVTADDIRKNIMEYCGVRIIVAKPYHLHNYRGFLDLEMQLAKALGVRHRPLTQKQWDARVALRKELLRKELL